MGHTERTDAVLSHRPRNADHSDGGAPLGLWFGIGAAVLVSLVVGALIVRRVRRSLSGLGEYVKLADDAKSGLAAREELLRTGVRAPAKVVEIRPTPVSQHNRPECELTLLVAPDGRAAYSVTFRQFVHVVELPRLVPGADVTVRVDPANPMRVTLEAPGSSPTATPV